MKLVAGKRLGPYQILAPLGARGMGEVYRARDGQPEHEIAIDVPPHPFGNDAATLVFFERDAQSELPHGG